MKTAHSPRHLAGASKAAGWQVVDEAIDQSKHFHCVCWANTQTIFDQVWLDQHYRDEPRSAVLPAHSSAAVHPPTQGADSNGISARTWKEQ